MLIKNEFKKGIKHITGEHDSTQMLMDIDVYKMEKDEIVSLCEDSKEVVILLMQGDVDFIFDGKKKSAKRDTYLNPQAICLHLCRGKKVEIRAKGKSELFIQKARNDADFASVYYEGDTIRSKITGETTWDGMAKRQVVTIIDNEVAPYSKLVLGEVVSFGGRWSSYTPHSHPQPEVYYYKFERDGGFGAGFVGENVYKIEDGTALCISGNNTHPQASAPGYDMYYVWAIRHLDGDRWLNTRVEDERYSWLHAEKL